MNIVQTIANELSIRPQQVEAVMKLLDEGATVPFIARYRKEVTGALDDTQLRNLNDRLQYLTELEQRRASILKSIEEQDKLSPELKKSILAATDKTTLEDLYLPYKPKRRTKAQIAREAGLEPLALGLLQDPNLDPEKEAANYLNKDVADVKAALEGARHILMENFSESAELLGKLREYFWQHGYVISKLVKGKEDEGQKFKDYFEFSEPMQKIPSHRLLAILRGRKEGILQYTLQFIDESHELYCIDQIASLADYQSSDSPADAWLQKTIEWTWKIKLHTKLELDLMSTLRESAEQEAIKVFKDNLNNLLMTAPAGNKVTMGLDPGLRTGVKVVVVDGTGKLLEHTTIFPHAPRNDWDKSIAILAALAQKHGVQLVSIGNGTASRETDKLVIELQKKYSELTLTKVVVSEAGASVYSASQLAADEFPDLDVSFRGAVSIARRLQDPLAELVKIDPKSIGVGQYQHDVNQVKLSRGLSEVMEDCVNAVGADVNTASVALLTSISGLNTTLASNIVTYRDKHGRFKDRQDLKNVPRMGDKTFEQAVGFLRIIDGDNPLDKSAVHPESYPLVDQMLNRLGHSIGEVIGNLKLLGTVDAQQFVNEQFGLPTVQDVIDELKKPGRDPRPEFKTAEFKEGVNEVSDLKPGMILQGVVTNVANFGAFVDVGVHQDGLVHISQLANRFVDDPHKVVKVGQIVQVKVLEVDVARKRISLTMKLDAEASKNKHTAGKKPQRQKAKKQTDTMGNFASKLSDALK